MSRFKVNQKVVCHGKEAIVVDIMDSYEDGEFSFKFQSPMYDIQYMDGKGEIVKEKDLKA